MLDADIGAYGPGLIWTGPLDNSLLEAMERLGAAELRLYRQDDLPIDDLSILSELKGLVGFSMSPSRRLVARDWSVLEQLEQLRYLHLTNDHASGRLHLDCFPQLQRLACAWWPGLRGLAETQLSGLGLRKWKVGGDANGLPASLRVLDLTQGNSNPGNLFDKLPSLEYVGLALLRNAKHLRGLAACDELRELSLVRMRSLEQIDAADLPATLQTILVEDCPKVADLDVSALSRLRGLFVVGDTGLRSENLKLPDHPQLKHVSVPSTRALSGVECRRSDDRSYGTPPSYAYRAPGIRRYQDIVRAQYARTHLYPAWLREEHPELCIE